MELAVSATTGALKSLLPKLTKLLADEYKLHKGVKDGIVHLQRDLESMQAALEKVSEVPTEELDKQVRLWARDVRELSYDIEDALDTHMVCGNGTRIDQEVEDRQFSSACFGIIKRFIRRIKGMLPPPPAAYRARRTIAIEIERIKNDVKEASERRERFRVDNILVAPARPRDPRLPALYEDVAKFVGTERSKEQLINLLSLEQKKLKLVAIVGIGGLGKTTLANMVYQKLLPQFDCGAFVSVSLKPNNKNILCRILRGVSKQKTENTEAWEEQEIIDRIREILKDQRYLIVIDDLWDESAWNYIKCALIENNCGSKIITTTRITDVAEICHSSDHVDGSIYELQPLCLADAEKLFYHKICGNQNLLPPEFKEMVQKTLRKCGGLPLAIVTLASFVGNKWTQINDQWNSIFNSVPTGLEGSHGVKDMRGILSLSYCDLPSQLKTCLLYLSIFPEDHIIEKDDLIRRWIAEGFVLAKHDENLYEVGQRYYKELINRSLIEPMNLGIHGQSQACRVHDMVLEFIASLSTEENFVTIINSQYPPSLPSKIRRLSVQGDVDNHSPHDATMNLSNVRSLTVFSKGIDLMKPLSRFKLLQVLEIKYCSSDSIKDIGYLLHLRYLRLSSTYFIELPMEIGNLHFLQILDVKRAIVKDLPSTVVQLRRLWCLYVNTKTKLPDGIGNIRSLEVLSEIDIGKYPNLLKELRNLTKLRVLQISLGKWDEGYEKPWLECLFNLKELQTLDIFTSCVSLDFMSAEGWTPPRLLRRFMASVHRQTDDIFGQWAELMPFSTMPRWINYSSLLNLSELSIRVTVLSQEDLNIFRDLRCLYSLDLHVGEATRDRLMITGSTDTNLAAPAFQCLGTMKFTCCAMVLVFEKGAMRRLQRLSLCFRLGDTKYVHPDFDFGFENLTSLKAVDIQIDCQSSFLWEVKAAEVAMWNAINSNPNHPTLDVTRHFERKMLWEENQDIQGFETMKEEEQAGITKIGPWGGNGGRPYFIKQAPRRLKSVTISSATAIDSLSFSYSDHTGKQHTEGPWGGHGGSNHTILLGSSEFLKEVSGTIGSIAEIVVTSITLVTNSGTYGPFGREEGTPFRTSTQSSGSIVGFYGHADHYVHAIGVYINREKKLDEGEVANQMELSKIGLWGGNRGRNYDVKVTPHCLQSVTICSDMAVCSLAFSYSDRNGLQHTAGLWGRNGGSSHTIFLGPSEFITEVRGTIGPYTAPNYKVITSLKFVTNFASYGPFGKGRGIPFHTAAPGNNNIVGFFGRAGWYVDAIGVYVSHDSEKTSKKEKAEVAKIGLWGGNGGVTCDVKAEPYRLENVTICSGAIIDSLAFSFSDRNQNQHTEGPWGGNGGTSSTIQLGTSERLLKVSGTLGPFSSDIITSITLVTNCATYGPFGHQSGTPFRTSAKAKGSIVGFFARAGHRVDAIGVYMDPDQDNSMSTKFGPWGGNGGRLKDINESPRHLHSITICSEETVNSLAFSYSDRVGRVHNVSPWGRQLGINQTIQLGPSEILKEVSGTFGPYSSDVVTSLTLVTNARSYGPFGQERGTPFHTSTEGNGSIVGFFGRAAWYVDAIGVYVNPEQ